MRERRGRLSTLIGKGSLVSGVRCRGDNLIGESGRGFSSPPLSSPSFSQPSHSHISTSTLPFFLHPAETRNERPSTRRCPGVSALCEEGGGWLVL